MLSRIASPVGRSRTNRSAPKPYAGNEGYASWHKREQGQNPFLRLDTYDLKEELERETPRSGEWMDDRELSITRNLAQTILSLYKGCQAKAGYTPEAAEFLDAYGSQEGQERKAKELFGEVLSQIK